jgi:crotonobetaine/carnitine-CoA ligase
MPRPLVGDHATAGTVRALLDAAVHRGPDRVFLLTENTELSYGRVLSHTRGVASALAGCGIGPGDRVLAAVPNSAECVLLALGCLYRGAVYAPVNPRSTRSEFLGLSRQASPKIVVVDDRDANATVLRSAADEDRTPVQSLVDLAQATAAEGPDAVDSRTPALLIATSGSTSAPKLVAHDHASVTLAAEGFPHWLGLDAADRLLTALPLFHANALVYSLLGAIAAAASLVVLPRFSARNFWSQTREHAASQFNLLGNIGEILLRTPESPAERNNPIRICYSGWAPSEARHRAFEERFALSMTVGYAMSESFYGTVWTQREDRPYGTIGELRQHPRLGTINEGRVLDVRSGTELPDDEVGVLHLRNPATMSGYFGRPDETAAVLADGWLNTGDLVARGNDGNFRFVGRTKDIIRRSGENYAPVEVEDVLLAHPAIAEAAVVAVPSPLADDDAKAFVVTDPADGSPAAVMALALLEWCRARLSDFKLPRYIEFVAALPRTPTGRVRKNALSRERTATEVDLETFRRRLSPSATTTSHEGGSDDR